MTEILARDFGSLDRWRAEFRAMGYALGGGSGWVLLTYVPRDGRLINQYAAEHSQAVASGVPILALDMYEHAYHMDFGANARAYVDTFLRNVDWPALELRYEDAAKVRRPRPLEQPEFGDAPGIGVEEVREMMAAGKPVQVIDVRPRASVSRLQDIAEGVQWRDPGAAPAVDGRAVEVRTGGRLLRLRLPRRLQDRDQAARGGIRREVHEQRTLRLEGGGRTDEDVCVIAGPATPRAERQEPVARSDCAKWRAG